MRLRVWSSIHDFGTNSDGCWPRAVNRTVLGNNLALEYFNFEFVFSFVSKPMGTTFNNNLWEIKKNLISNYRKFVFLNDFTCFPFITIGDMILLNPFIRVILLTNVSEDETIKRNFGGFLFINNGQF